MKKKKTMLAVAAAAALSIILSSVPGAFAAENPKYTNTEGTATNWLTGDGITVTTAGSTNTSSYNNAPVYKDKKCTEPFTVNVAASDPTTEIKKVLVVPDDATIPECEFTFTATAGAAITPAEAGNLPLFAGVNPEKIKWRIVKSSSNDFLDAGVSSNVSDLTSTSVTTAPTSSAANVEYVPNVVTTGIKDENIDGDTTLTAPTDNVVIMTGDADTYYAVKEFQLDFSGCVFTEPGVYRYILTESKETGEGAKANMGITNDENPTRTLDVYVEDASYYTEAESVVTFHPTLRITKYILYTGTITAAPKKADSATAGTTPDTKFEDGSTRTDEYGFDNEVEAEKNKKSVGFKNTYKTNKLKITKAVNGNQGSRDQYFKFTLKSNTDDNAKINNNAVFYVSKDAADTSISNNLSAVNSATSYTVNTINTANKFTELTGTYANLDDTKILGVFTGSDLKAGVDFYLQHDQYITVTGLPTGIGYTVTEASEDYKATYTVRAKKDDNTTALDNYTGETPDTTTGAYTGGTVITKPAATTGNIIATDSALTKDAQVDFTNTKEGVIPTGVILSVAAPVIIGIIAAAGIIAIFMRKRRKAD